MHKLTSLLLPLLLGLVIGWFAHQYQNNKSVKQVAAAETPQIVPSSPSAQTMLADLQPKEQLSVVQLLEHHDDQAVLERYESLQALTDSTLMNQARAEILIHAQNRLKAHDFVSAVQLLQGFLLVSYRDSEARLLLAEAYVGQEDYLIAIEQMYEARGVAIHPQMLARLTERLRFVARKQAELYRKNADHAQLLSLYQSLTQKEPDYAPWFIELALVQLTLDDQQAAQNSLALVTSDPDVGEQARSMLIKLKQTSSVVADTESAARVTDISGIPLTRKGHSFLVEASLQNNNSLQLLLDTGASMTILTPQVLQQSGIGYQDSGVSHVFSTANGAVRAPVYTLESLTVGDWTIEQLEVGVLELNGIDGLLGMNFLSHFRFFIDQRESVLRLSPN